jgi:glutamyl-tRNA synthetase
MATVRTRFAPSPTGPLHIGGARTALFNFLHARRHGGAFILRIEDTDRERSTEEHLRAILDGLKWLGLEWDEGPYRQSERMTLYQERIEQLLRAGRAYRCVCSAADVQRMREAALAAGRKPAYEGRCRDRRIGPHPGQPFTVRFQAAREGETVVDDLIKGRVIFQNRELDDLVIARSDGTPTYNLCVVVDDVEMAITHVIRGDDHLANTPRQVLIYEALGSPVPRFAHVPLILGTDRARLSKRHGAMSVTAYREAGYLPTAMVNYLARLGWSHGDQEVFSLAELVRSFTVEDVGKAAGIFNPEKLLWLNAQYIKSSRSDELARAALPFLAAAGHTLDSSTDLAWLARVVELLQTRARTLVELAELAGCFLADEISIDADAAAKFLTRAIAPALEDLAGRLAGLPEWTQHHVQQAFESVLAERGLSLGTLAQPARVAITGKVASPGIFEVMALMGRERTVRRLRIAVGRTGMAAHA